jgi:cysteine sulfinate desulfinase/cysteine desulfurase-like protein
LAVLVLIVLAIAALAKYLMSGRSRGVVRDPDISTTTRALRLRRKSWRRCGKRWATPSATAPAFIGQERAGHERALLATALGAACEIASKNSTTSRVAASSRDRFWEALRDHFGQQVRLNGHPQHRLPNTLNVSFVGCVGADILAMLEGGHFHRFWPAIPGGSNSPVLQAMGVPPEIGMGAIRFSLGRGTTAEEVDIVVERLKRIRA